MRRYMSIALTILVASSLALTACNRQSAVNPSDVGQPNTSVSQGRSSAIDNGTTTQTTGAYMDGIYSGVGDPTTSGNAVATVYITGGKITDIYLSGVNNLGRYIADGYGNVVNDNTNVSGGTASGVSDGSVAPESITLGTENGTGTSGTGIPGTASGTDNNMNNTDGITSGSVPGTASGVPQTNGNPGSQSIIPGTNNTATQSGTDRNALVNAMISSQTYDVDTSSYGNRTQAENWKLAVRRALEKAR